MGGAASITSLADVDRLPDGAMLRLPPYPELQVMRLQLAPGERVPLPPRLALRQVLVEQGQLAIGSRGAGRPELVGVGQWAVDDGARSWCAGDRGPVQVLVLQHVSREDAWASGRARASVPGSAQGSAPGGPPAFGDPTAAPPAREPEPEPMRFTSDYTGQPIVMRDGPLRAQIHRYVIREGAQLHWHLHPHQRYAYVESGQLTVEDQRGHHRTYGPGQVLVEQQEVVHRGLNPGRDPVSLLVFDYMPTDMRSNTVLFVAPGGPPARP